jgi:translation initiation factor IF-1
MAGESAFKVEGLVVETLPNGTYWVELSNGHKVRAFAVGRAKQSLAGLQPGNKVKLQMTPYDLSAGRIVVETKPI